jgi:hypothetical protein
MRTSTKKRKKKSQMTWHEQEGNMMLCSGIFYPVIAGRRMIMRIKGPRRKKMAGNRQPWNLYSGGSIGRELL